MSNDIKIKYQLHFKHLEIFIIKMNKALDWDYLLVKKLYKYLVRITILKLFRKFKKDQNLFLKFIKI